MQTPGQHVFCRAICSRPVMTAWGALRREGTQHPFADDRLLCLCAQEPPASIDRVCSASALQNGIPDDAAGGRGRRRCAVSGYARHAMTSMVTVTQNFKFCPPCKTHTPWVGSRSPDGWDQIPRWAGGWVLHQPPWSFGFDSQTRGTRENRRTLC